MIDHILGRPSVRFRKIQVLAVVFVWTAYLLAGNPHGPYLGRRISQFFSERMTAWQTLIATLLTLYVSRNFGKLVGLECPEPLANIYTRNFFRATWVTTALDAGFWSAMHIQRPWLRDLASVVCSVYYLVAAEQADEKMRKVRSVITVEHMRVSWNKSTTPYLSLLGKLTRPVKIKYPPRAIRIPRPEGSSYTEPVHGWLYFDGPISGLKKHTKIVLDIPGGGFVAMSPRNHEDKLIGWAAKTKMPVLSLDYKKAPEFPYPYGLNECFDVYEMIVASRGRCIGLSGDEEPRIVLAGDSAGGNIAAAMTLMIVETQMESTRRFPGNTCLPVPEGLILVYPALDMNIGNWMTDEQMSLIRDKHSGESNKALVKRKKSDFKRRAPQTPIPSDDDDSPAEDYFKTPIRNAARSQPELKEAGAGQPPVDPSATATETADSADEALKTRLAMPSLFSYVSDRVLVPEMMCAMIILYIGPHNRPNFATEYLLSPVLAPDAYLARFPKTYFMTGERDPLVDDTAIMAGRIRAAKAAAFQEHQQMGLISAKAKFDHHEYVQVKYIEGVSHGFMMVVSAYAEGWNYINRAARWFEECFEATDKRAKELAVNTSPATLAELQERQRLGLHIDPAHEGKHHHRSLTASSTESDFPLEISNSKIKSRAKAAGLKSLKPINKETEHTDSNGNANGVEDDLPLDDSSPTTPYTGLAREHPMSKSREWIKRKSLVSLNSDEDIMGRRMNGLVGNLTRKDRVVP